MAFLDKLVDKRGLTLVELVIAIGMIAFFAGLISIRLVGVREKTSLGTTISTLTSDIKSQQLKAIVFDTDGDANQNSYGVHFETDTYTLFRGSSYISSDPANFSVSLGKTITFSSVLFPSSQIVFAKGSGEISGFVSGSDTITLNDSISEESKTVKFNINGTVISVQ